MPISSGWGAAVWTCVAGVLLGCSAPELVGRSFTPLAGSPVVTLAVQEAAVTIKGPEGYCIDKTSTRETADGTFVMMGDCARLYREATTSPEVSLVLTALVSGPSEEPQLPSNDQLKRYFTSEEGRAAISVSGQAETVSLLETAEEAQTLLVALRDSSENRPDGLSDISWRAILVIRDRLVSLSATPHVEEPVPSAQTKALLVAFITEMRAANLETAEY